MGNMVWQCLEKSSLSYPNFKMYDTTKPYKKQILELISQTWETSYVSVKEGIVKKKFSYPETSSTDGIGTKGIYHWQQKSFKKAVIDALAMNLNDLVLMRARAYGLHDHIMIPEDNHKAIIEIVESLSEECQKRNIGILSGETAIHNDLSGLEISVNIDGFIKKPKLNLFLPGGVLIGIKSNGLHSNGFTKVREAFGNEFRKEFIEPTLIYSDILLNINEKYDIRGMMHITGGAYTKLKDFLSKENISIHNNHKLKPHNIFYEIYDKGIPDKRMYKTFNCGVGFVLSVTEKDAKSIISEIEDSGFLADEIGRVVKGDGKVSVESMFSDEKIIF